MHFASCKFDHGLYIIINYGESDFTLFGSGSSSGFTTLACKLGANKLSIRRGFCTIIVLHYVGNEKHIKETLHFFIIILLL